MDLPAVLGKPFQPALERYCRVEPPPPDISEVVVSWVSAEAFCAKAAERGASGAQSPASRQEDPGHERLGSAFSGAVSVIL